MKDSIELLKECDAGLEMAISSLEQVKPEAKAENFTNLWELNNTLLTSWPKKKSHGEL